MSFFHIFHIIQNEIHNNARIDRLQTMELYGRVRRTLISDSVRDQQNYR